MSKSHVSRRVFLRTSAAVVAVPLVATPSQSDDHKVTPTQVEGPFFPIHEQRDKDADLTHVEGRDGHALGEVITVSGQVMDEDGNPVEGALIDIWQANAAGKYEHEGDTSDKPLDPNFQGWAKLVTGADGRYSIKTIKPAAYRAQGTWTRPAHIHYKVARRGYNELITQMYFKGDKYNAEDRLLHQVSPEEQERLKVVFDGDGEGEFDIVLAKV